MPIASRSVEKREKSRAMVRTVFDPLRNVFFIMVVPIIETTFPKIFHISNAG
jgi:hypothetical protein